ncbi:MAG: aminoacetone oxidase family FAD-binding enzyme [Coriobacteriia bacterium]|nr:aminoacetone oxidase family FAD-binding enzyme [Coriobacteriia bacterium]
MSESGVLIVGAGAAGLSAAIAASRLGVPVTLLERDTRVGRKILVSGNGRCNLSNTSALPVAYNHPDFVEPVLDRYPCEAVRVFFGDMGLVSRADEEGRVYPVSNSAASVLDVLRLECARLGVEVRCEFEAERVAQVSGSTSLAISSQDGTSYRADAVIVATGGGRSLLVDSGHTMVGFSPVLGPIKTDTAPIRGLSGVRVRCAATLFAGVAEDTTGGDPVATERGELLFRDYGVSGIMVFDLSRHIEPGCALSIDLFPDTSVSEVSAMISQRCEVLSWRTAETFFAGMLHDRIARALLRHAGIAPDTPVGKLPQGRISSLLKDFRLRVIGMGDAAQAQVTRGGASVEEFDPSTMASRRVDGLFAAGEVLDVDGRSGGFNLHWAWASGIVAGEAAARLSRKRAAEYDAHESESL